MRSDGPDRWENPIDLTDWDCPEDAVYDYWGSDPARGRLMTEQPDLSTLPQRMRYAAAVMREATKRLDMEMLYPFSSPPTWAAWALERRADIWEKANSVEREALVEELAQQLMELDANATIFVKGYSSSARKLIESGWRKP
jgi:hypothetical protein